jgi:outer membrane protein OmpA-like peptidoglycan-associated protein
MHADVKALEQQVNEATRTIQEQYSAIAASSRSAAEAAARAEMATQERNQAESSRQQAESVRQQAESGRQQAQAEAQQAEAAAQRANEQAQQAQAKMTEMQQEREAELNHMQEALGRIAETHRTPTGMMIVLPNSIFRFEFDKANLSQANRELLSRIAGILLASKGYGLSVFGYTDDIGTPEYNEQLSLKRAEAVKNYLVQAGIDTAIINVKGYGKTSPLVDGSHDDARAKNRRVEIAVTESSIKFQ